MYYFVLMPESVKRIGETNGDTIKRYLHSFCEFASYVYEKSNETERLGEWVLTNAFRPIKGWFDGCVEVSDDGKATDIYYSVNPDTIRHEHNDNGFN